MTQRAQTDAGQNTGRHAGQDVQRTAGRDAEPVDSDDVVITHEQSDRVQAAEYALLERYDYESPDVAEGPGVPTESVRGK